MSKLQDSVVRYLDSQNWVYDFDEERRFYSLRMSLECVDSCRLVIDLKENEAGEDIGFLCYSFFPISVPESKRDAAAQFLTRANYNLLNGNFEMDYEDGEVRYKVMTRCGDIDYDPESMEVIVDCGFAMLDRYGPGLLSVIYSNTNPKEACASCEKRD